MIKALSVFERTYCGCSQCQLPCTSGKPGMLAPGDIDTIADFLGLEETSEEFTLTMFKACDDGPQVACEKTPNGRAPALRPATREDGTCVFYDNGGCTIHAVAPFECSRVNRCDEPSGAAAMKRLGQAVRDSVDYIQHWWWIWNKQKGR